MKLTNDEIKSLRYMIEDRRKEIKEEIMYSEYNLDVRLLILLFIIPILITFLIYAFFSVLFSRKISKIISDIVDIIVNSLWADKKWLKN